MAQFDHGTINPATKTGSALAGDLNNRAAAENSTHAGSSRPSYAAAGLVWVNNSFSPPHVMLFDGTDDIDLTLQFADSAGTMKATGRPVLEDGWLWCAGQAVSRSTYAALFNAITAQVTGNTSNTSTTISSVSADLRNIGLVGAPIEGTNIQAGTVIAAIGASTITLSLPATGTATGVSLRVLPHGVGNGSTTFNVPDARGRALAGRDDMNASAASRLTTGGAGLDGSRLGLGGGAQVISLDLTQIPAHAHTASTSGTSASAGDHDHGGGTSGGGAHNHGGATYAEGAHNHGGLTQDANSSHDHGYMRYNSLITLTGGNAFDYTNIWRNTATANSNDGGANHKHPIPTQAAHQHGISGEANHTHPIASGGAHVHTLSLTTTVNSAGGGGAHGNVQPTLISNIVIKT